MILGKDTQKEGYLTYIGMASFLSLFPVTLHIYTHSLLRLLPAPDGNLLLFPVQLLQNGSSFFFARFWPIFLLPKSERRAYAGNHTDSH